MSVEREGENLNVHCRQRQLNDKMVQYFRRNANLNHYYGHFVLTASSFIVILWAKIRYIVI